MDLTPKDKLSSIPDLRHRLRQLRWFSKAFRNNAELVKEHFGFSYRIDDKLLNQVFFDWLAAIDQQDDSAAIDRADYIVFVAGLALRELIRTKPAVMVSDAGTSEADDKATLEIARFWPEGFLYTNFCVCGIAAVQEQEFGQSRDLEKAASDLRVWWSYRENAEEDPNMSIAFLDQFVGLEPNWLFPAMAQERAAIKNALAAPRETVLDRLPPAATR